MKKVVALIIFLFAVSYAAALPVRADFGTGSAQYDLPYPGVLPDSPLWPVKDLRDRLIGLFIFDPVAKGHYEVRLADKKLAMAQVLINSGQKELGEKALTWAADGYNRAVDKVEEAKLKKLKYETLISRLSLFASKYNDSVGLSQPIHRIKKLFTDQFSNP